MARRPRRTTAGHDHREEAEADDHRRGTTTEEGTTTDSLLPVAPGTTDGGLVGQALNDIGPKKADEVPMPVIVLGGLAVLLILAGAGGLIAQRRSRRGLEDDMPSSDAPGAETAS